MRLYAVACVHGGGVAQCDGPNGSNPHCLWEYLGSGGLLYTGAEQLRSREVCIMYATIQPASGAT